MLSFRALLSLLHESALEWLASKPRQDDRPKCFVSVKSRATRASGLNPAMKKWVLAPYRSLGPKHFRGNVFLPDGAFDVGNTTAAAGGIPVFLFLSWLRPRGRLALILNHKRVSLKIFFVVRWVRKRVHGTVVLVAKPEHTMAIPLQTKRIVTRGGGAGPLDKEPITATRRPVGTASEYLGAISREGCNKRFRDPKIWRSMSHPIHGFEDILFAQSDQHCYACYYES